ncbi:DNA damage-inducible protein 1 [Entomophthora muscae]|uniref:DNA damage-inducible protein 1 n=1 Tax=Entomophthora muscae TaxID=34485 RepID=A0ACC2SXU7_9FUNG|nr:DNA damage-inducible protein 1 [Entomophthora muscae]
MAKPYLLQSVESDDTDPQDNPNNPSIFVNASIPLPLQIILKIEVTIFDTDIRAVLDTGAPTNIISSRLVRSLGFLPDILYVESFFTAGVESIKSNGAYSSVPLRFGEIVVTYPVVVLESESYDMLIGTDFLRTYHTEISYLHGHFSILGYTISLLFKDSSDAFMASKEETDRRHVCLWYPHGVLGLPYKVANASVKSLPTYGNNQKGFKPRSNQLVRIPPKTQVAVDTGLYLNLTPGLHIEISSINAVSCKEPLAAPGIHDSAT